MKKFLSWAALFFVPVLLVYLVFGVALYRSGEWRTEEEIVQRAMDGEDTLMGLAYRDNTFYYKHLGASAKKADLLVLGTSRSMQFASQFFRTDSFYNAGGGAGYPHAYRFFLDTLPEDAIPKTMILVFDQYFFESGWTNVDAWPELDFAHYTFDLRFSLPRFIKDWAQGKFRFRDMMHPPEGHYGIAAIGRGSGFHADGSYCYGDLMDHPERGSDVGFHDSFDRIATGTQRFEWASTLYQPSLDEIDKLLQDCYDKGIQVVGIIPPYAPSVYQRMQETGLYTYMDQLPAALRQLTDAYGFELYDFTNMPDTRDEEYIDGYHGGDRVYARLTLELSQNSNILRDLIDTEYLTLALEKSPNPLRLSA